MRIATACVGLVIALSGASAQEQSDFGASGAEQRMRDYVRVWEADERVGPRAMGAYYADRVVYYGKHMTRAQVLADKLRFIRSYPERVYDIAPGSLRTRCERGRCTARAVLRWSRTSQSGRRERGASALTLVFSAQEKGRIVRESATTLRRSR